MTEDEAKDLIERTRIAVRRLRKALYRSSETMETLDFVNEQVTRWIKKYGGLPTEMPNSHIFSDVRGTIIDAFRRKVAAKRNEALRSEIASDIPEEFATPEDALAAVADQLWLQGQMNALKLGKCHPLVPDAPRNPETAYSVLERHIKGKTYAEISTDLGIGVSSVYMHMRKTIGYLASCARADAISLDTASSQSKG